MLRVDFAYLKSCCDHSLTRDNSRKNGNDQARVECARRYRVEERVGIGTLVLADVCSLPDVLDIIQRSEDRHEIQMEDVLLLVKDTGRRSITTRAGWH